MINPIAIHFRLIKSWRCIAWNCAWSSTRTQRKAWRRNEKAPI